MTLTDLRRRCEERLHELPPLPEPFNVRTFVPSVAELRGRPIQLLPIETSSGPHGLWVATDQLDLIFFEAHTSAAHQDHIILHELCHLLCEHEPRLLDHPGRTELLLPDIASETVARMLGRSTYSDDDEREAELLASIIVERSMERRVIEPAASAESAEIGLDRLAAALENAAR